MVGDDTLSEPTLKLIKGRPASDQNRLSATMTTCFFFVGIPACHMINMEISPLRYGLKKKLFVSCNGPKKIG